MSKPRVTIDNVADTYASPNERIVEFSFDDGSGGLISFRETQFGNVVDAYRIYGDIKVLASPEALPPGPKPTPLDEFMAAVKEEMAAALVSARLSGALPDDIGNGALHKIVLQIVAERFAPSHGEGKRILANLHRFI